MHDTLDFVRTVICKGNLWSYTLYNCDNLALDSDDIMLTDGQAALAKGDFAAYGRAQDRLKAALAAAIAAQSRK
jgi:hypothetical protein